MGEGAPGAFFLGDAAAMMPELLERYRGQAQCIYLDPPFATGNRFVMKMRVGEKDWKGGHPSLTLTAYEDDQDRAAYLAMMRTVLEGAHALLHDTGVIFLHIDFRMHAQLRLLMDEVFGEHNLLNEIIWTYQTGGRAKRYFSRKHDVILFYRKGARYFFNIKATGMVNPEARRNHMKRHVDADGRVYRSIRSGGKVYTYYDDDPVYPSDVWDDVSHLHQKDPQRTGYDTQKPARLLERIIGCSTRPDDLVMDLFAGSGTTLAAAWSMGRRFAGVDVGRPSMHVVRRRLMGANVSYFAPPSAGAPEVSVRALVGVGYYEVELVRYQLESGVSARMFPGLDALDNWAVGYLRGGVFFKMAEEARTFAQPALSGRLRLPVLTGTPAIRLNDVLGRAMYFELDKDGMEI